MDLMHVYVVNEAKNLPFTELLESCPGIEVTGLTTSLTVARQQLSLAMPDIILYNPQETGSEFARIQEIRELCPPAMLVILAAPRDPDYVRNCLRAGANDFLATPIEPAVLQGELEKIYDRSQRRQKRETLSVLMDRFTNKPRIASFISGKGGVGKTTIAVNTAVTLAQMAKRVVLVDLDADLAGTELFLGLEPKHTLSDLAEVPVEAIPSRIMEFVEWHSSGLAVLCAPKFSTGIGELSVPLVRVVLQALQRSFQIVVVDLPPVVDTYSLAVLEMSHMSYMVSTPNLSTLSTNNKLRELFVRLGYDVSKVTNILNCVGVRHGVRTQDCVRLLHSPVELTLPYDFRRTEQATNRGTPLALEPRSALAKAFRTIADSIAGTRRGNAQTEVAAAAESDEAKAK